MENVLKSIILRTIVQMSATMAAVILCGGQMLGISPVPAWSQWTGTSGIFTAIVCFMTMTVPMVFAVTKKRYGFNPVFLYTLNFLSAVHFIVVAALMAAGIPMAGVYSEMLMNAGWMAPGFSAVIIAVGIVNFLKAIPLAVDELAKYGKPRHQLLELAAKVRGMAA